MHHSVNRPGNRPNIPRVPTEHLLVQSKRLGAQATARTAEVGSSRLQGYNGFLFPKSAEKLIAGTRGVIGARLREVREKTANEQLTRLAVVRRAFIVQDRRLQQPEMEDLTTSQLTSEFMARAVLFSPTASEAQQKGNKRSLAEFNDMLMACATVISPSAANAFVPMMEGEIRNFCQHAGHSADIVEDNNIKKRVVGLSSEIATTRALLTDPELQVSNPGIAQDLEGIDVTVQRGDAKVNIDLKRGGAFLYRLEDLQSMGHLNAEDYEAATHTGIAFTGYSNHDNTPKYAVNAELFGKMDGFDYTQRGQATVLDLAHGLLDRQAA